VESKKKIKAVDSGTTSHYIYIGLGFELKKHTGAYKSWGLGFTHSSRAALRTQTPHRPLIFIHRPPEILFGGYGLRVRNVVARAPGPWRALLYVALDPP
jgi:hypothetical protein